MEERFGGTEDATDIQALYSTMYARAVVVRQHWPWSMLVDLKTDKTFYRNEQVLLLILHAYTYPHPRPRHHPRLHPRPHPMRDPHRESFSRRSVLLSYLSTRRIAATSRRQTCWIYLMMTAPWG